MTTERIGGGLCVLVAALLLVPASASAQGPRLQLDNLKHLVDQASNATDISLDPAMLQLAAGFLSNDQPGQSDVKALIAGLTGIYVKALQNMLLDSQLITANHVTGHYDHYTATQIKRFQTLNALSPHWYRKVNEATWTQVRDRGCVDYDF